MTSELIQGLYLSLLGISGVFIVLACLAGFLWLMGLIQSKRESYEVEEAPKRNERFSNAELLAIAVAVNFYHTLYEEVPNFKTSRSWKEHAKSFPVRT
jgi:sodium pump decarboxylase gamma subunit